MIDKKVMVDFTCPYCDFDMSHKFEDNINEIRWLPKSEIPNKLKCIHCGKGAELTNIGSEYYYGY